MSRAKHFATLIMKLVFITLVCAATMVMSAMQSVSTDEISITKDFGENRIDTLTENGATVTWEVVNGELVFDIKQSGDHYDDITVFLIFNNVGYDSTFIRSMLGDDAGEHEAFLSEMENGPWLAHCNFCLKGESFFTTGGGSYTFVDDALTDYVHSVLSSGANTYEQTEEFAVDKEDGTVMMLLIFGSEEGGALESGKYTLKADLKLGHPEGKQLELSPLQQAGIMLKLGGQAVADAGWGIFNVTSWLTFYGVMVLLGWFIYLWRDLRTMVKIFFALLEGDGTRVIIRTYINGVFAEESETYANGSNTFIALMLTILCYVVFLVTIPIRILIHIIRDIIYLFKEDDDIEAFSFLGNFLGSVGIYSLIVGFVYLMSASYAVGAIAAVLGIALCVAAHFICKHREEEYG
ncbi:MAG: hypothetical protein E7644_03390 [Ruminococcaceae bacterium]|nr:hypothetical protein [Oscillospiraceae bacterium]